MNRSWTPAIVWIRSDEGDLFSFKKKNFFDHPLSLLKIVLLGRLWPVKTAVSPHSWPLGTFCISFPPRKTSQWQRARRNSCFCRLPLLLPFGLASKCMWTLLFQSSCAGLPLHPPFYKDWLHIGKCCLPVRQQHVWWAALWPLDISRYLTHGKGDFKRALNRQLSRN